MFAQKHERGHKTNWVLSSQNFSPSKTFLGDHPVVQWFLEENLGFVWLMCSCLGFQPASSPQGFEILSWGKQALHTFVGSIQESEPHLYSDFHLQIPFEVGQHGLGGIVKRLDAPVPALDRPHGYV